ncbi:hypothetical protein [Erwinia persicina]|uniref:hypothetical protein n=1 Tax=Erwinia persicina TaxID=55211 RepID=UPI001781EB95|nr:hypothetical protein [Erwinia persicina]MBD8169419.1 hypothetical protein [Erwinia persicina]
MKLLPLLATLAVITLSLTTCMTHKEDHLLRKPLHLTVRVEDENGGPLTPTAIKVYQLVPGPDRFFCLSIPSLGGGGKNCGTSNKASIYKGEFPASGSLGFTALYLTGLYIEVAETCDNTVPNARRRYFKLTLDTGSLMDGQTITVKPIDNAQMGSVIQYKPCTTPMPSRGEWEDFY